MLAVPAVQSCLSPRVQGLADRMAGEHEPSNQAPRLDSPGGRVFGTVLGGHFIAPARPGSRPESFCFRFMHATGGRISVSSRPLSLISCNSKEQQGDTLRVGQRTSSKAIVEKEADSLHAVGGTSERGPPLHHLGDGMAVSCPTGGPRLLNRTP